MGKTLIVGLLVIVVAALMVSALGSRETQAGLTTPTATVTDSPSPSPSPSPTASPSPAPSATTGSPSASPSASPLPAAAPQTGGQPGSGGWDALVLTLVLGAAAVIGVGGVFAGKFALDRRS